MKKNWSKEVDPVVNIATFLVAFSVWIGETRQNWKSSLPKKLTVIFFHKGVELLRCNYAHLDHEADIRNLGQQIGRQMNKDTNLQFFAPKILRKKGEINFDEKGDAFMHYVATFILTKPPENLQSGKCLVWEPPFDVFPNPQPCKQTAD